MSGRLLESKKEKEYKLSRCSVIREYIEWTDEMKRYSKKLVRKYLNRTIRKTNRF